MMTYFKENTQKDAKINAIDEHLLPTIYINSEALIKMHVYVQECADEIGWLGTAYEHNGDYIIDDVFLFDQEVHATTTEITPEGLSQFAEELLSQGDEGIKIWNNLRLWGHSHVRMGVSPSGQDDAQMKTFANAGHPWFIRLIANKNGDIRVDVYHYQNRVAYMNVAWKVMPADDEIQIQKQIDELQQKLDLLREQKYQYFESHIKEEMKEKVRKKTYVSTYSYYGKQYAPSQQNQQTTKKEEKEKAKVTYYDDYGYENPYYNARRWIDQYDDIIEDEKDVNEYLYQTDINYIAKLGTIDEVESYLEDMGYVNYFTTNDLIKIQNFCRKNMTK